jgi:hypothetical protein
MIDRENYDLITRVANSPLQRCRRKRVVVLMGAGASIEYEAPSTPALTDAIERSVMADAYMTSTGAKAAFVKIKRGLQGYLREVPNFEQIYHCTHELLSLNAPTPGAFDEFRPLLYPFMADKTGIPKRALEALIDKMAQEIFTEVSTACARNPLSLAPLTDFVSRLRADCITRIYTTNYDDFLIQAAPDLYTGFDPEPSPGPKRFQLDRFWSTFDLHSAFYLHGSVHMGFVPPGSHSIPPSRMT